MYYNLKTTILQELNKTIVVTHRFIWKYLQKTKKKNDVSYNSFFGGIGY